MLKKSRKQGCLILVCVLCLLAGCGSDGAQMRRQLAELEQRNCDDQPMLNDTLAEALVDYFDRHGTPNERMRAKYILGRTYFDLGELPRALETYNEAANCADTTAMDCDFAKLSRVHAQKAKIFNLQIQPQSQLSELRKAVSYAAKGSDSLMAIECYAQQANAYDFLHHDDSVILVKERAAEMYRAIGRNRLAAQTIDMAILSLIRKGYIDKARKYLSIYESESGNFDKRENIEKGREIHYYIKGMFYLSVNKLDSAELMFRKELRDGQDLNNQIAGCKGLQEVYGRKRLSDSIAKYATMGYNLNDSAYSLSEMQNIQKMQASYDYSYQKLLAEQSERRADRIRDISILVVIVIILLCIMVFRSYRSKKARELAEYRINLASLEKVQSELQELCGDEADVPTVIARKNAEIKELQKKVSDFQKRQPGMKDPELEEKLKASDIVTSLNRKLDGNPVQTATTEDMRKLRSLVNEHIPDFYGVLNASVTLRPIEYEVCLLIRCHFKPASIGRLLGREDAYVSNIRRRILKKAFGIDGNPRELDDRIMGIR